jgi:hypothetical protein
MLHRILLTLTCLALAMPATAEHNALTKKERKSGWKLLCSTARMPANGAATAKKISVTSGRCRTARST